MKNDATLLQRIKEIIANRPTYGYRRVCAILNRSQTEEKMPAINHKRVYRIMRQNDLLLLKSTNRVSDYTHDGRVITLSSNMRWCSDGFEIPCDNGERVKVLFGIDTCDREIMAYAVTTGGYTADMAQNVMLACVEHRFGDIVASRPVEWLSDNGSCYSAKDTRMFAEAVGLKCKYTPVRSPQSNGVAEAFVKTFKRDYVYCHARPDARTLIAQIGDWIEDYNENAPHKGLKMLSPREYIRKAYSGDSSGAAIAKPDKCQQSAEVKGAKRQSEPLTELIAWHMALENGARRNSSREPEAKMF